MPGEKGTMGFNLPYRLVEQAPNKEPPPPVSLRPNPDPRFPMFLNAVLPYPDTQVILGPNDVQFIGHFGTICFKGQELTIVYMAPFLGEEEIVLYQGPEMGGDAVSKQLVEGEG